MSWYNFRFSGEHELYHYVPLTKSFMKRAVGIAFVVGLFGLTALGCLNYRVDGAIRQSFFLRYDTSTKRVGETKVYLLHS